MQAQDLCSQRREEAALERNLPSKLVQSTEDTETSFLSQWLRICVPHVPFPPWRGW